MQQIRHKALFSVLVSLSLGGCFLKGIDSGGDAQRAAKSAAPAKSPPALRAGNPPSTGLVVRNRSKSAVETLQEYRARTGQPSTNATDLGGPVHVTFDVAFPDGRCLDKENFKREFPFELARIACYGGDTRESWLSAAAQTHCHIDSCPAEINFQEKGGSFKVQLTASMGGSTTDRSRSTSSSTDDGNTGTSSSRSNDGANWEVKIMVRTSTPTTLQRAKCINFMSMPNWTDFVNDANTAVDNICAQNASRTTPNPATPR